MPAVLPFDAASRWMARRCPAPAGVNTVRWIRLSAGIRRVGLAGARPDPAPAAPRPARAARAVSP